MGIPLLNTQDPSAPQGNTRCSLQCGLLSHTLLTPPRPKKASCQEGFSWPRFPSASPVWQASLLPAAGLALGFPFGLTHPLALKGFLPGVCFWGPRLSCAETPHHLFPFLGHMPRFVSGNKGLGNGGVGIAVTQWEEEQIGTGRRCHGWEKTPEDGGKGWIILMGYDV